jgi:glutamate dehydrogenase/leucine dehydrogenase
VLGPDVMTGPQHMLWMLDEYETIHGAKARALSPANRSGTPGRKGAKKPAVTA